MLDDHPLPPKQQAHRNHSHCMNLIASEDWQWMASQMTQRMESLTREVMESTLPAEQVMEKIAEYRQIKAWRDFPETQRQASVTIMNAGRRGGEHNPDGE